MAQDQHNFVNRKVATSFKPPSYLYYEQQNDHFCSCFSFFKSSKKKRGKRNNEQDFQFGSAKISESNEWLIYLYRQLENSIGSSSTKKLGFSWASELYRYVSDYQPFFNLNKYRSAVFYLNYSLK